MQDSEPPYEINEWQAFKQELKVELEQAKNSYKEISQLLEQSQVEVNKLAQKNTGISSKLQLVQAQFDSVPRNDIRIAYDAAMDAIQRLFVMRGQSEKLTSDQVNAKKYLTWLEKVSRILEGGQEIEKEGGRKTTIETVEMLVQAQEIERQRLSRQMHDGPAQALSNFILQTEIAMRLFDIDQAKAKEELASLKNAASLTFQKVRDFIFELRPMMLDDLGLAPTLKRYVDAFKGQQNVDATVTIMGMDKRLEPYLEVLIFRAIQELLGNAVRQSQATQVKIQVDMGERNIKVNVVDNGRGIHDELFEERGNVGITIIRERIEMLKGLFEIEGIPGQGTQVMFQIPVVEAVVLT
jgi:two-component system sensor histidine kinase DegS